MIEIIGLSKVYVSKKKERKKALNKINLTLPSTGMVFLLGKSGSGKSTLLNIMQTVLLNWQTGKFCRIPCKHL